MPRTALRIQTSLQRWLLFARRPPPSCGLWESAPMIINGGARSNGAFFAKHLTNGENNEHVTLCEMRNLSADNIPDALQEMAAVAMGTFCKNYFYHANINPQAA